MNSEAPSISRRRIATGLAWSVPAVVVATATPALAMSPCKGCHTLQWNQFAVGTDVNGRVATTVADGEPCPNPPTVALAVTKGGSAGTVNAQTRTSSEGLYSAAFNGKVDYRGEQNDYPAGSRPFEISGTSASDPGLILNIGYRTTTTVTFSFPVEVNRLSFDIHDITRSNHSNDHFKYTDTVSTSTAVTLTGTSTRTLNRTSGTGPFNRTVAETSSETDAKTIRFTQSTDEPLTSFTLTYTAPREDGWQFIVIDDLHFCIV